MRSEMPVDLAGCVIQVDASKAWFHRRVLPLSIEQLRWRPAPLRWSIAECLDHVNITLGLYLPKIDKAIQKGVRPRNAGGARYGKSEMDAVLLIEPPVMTPGIAPTVLLPEAAVDLDWLVDQFHLTRDRYADALRRVMHLNLGHVQIRQPLHPFLRTLGGTLAFIAAHDRRHLWQAEQVRNKPNFPRALFAA